MQEDHTGLQSASPQWEEGNVVRHSILDVTREKLGGGRVQTDHDLRERDLYAL